MAASETLSQIAPGQLCTLSQGAGRWREVRCEEFRGDALYLSVIKGRGEGSLSAGGPCAFQTISEKGILRCNGQLKGVSDADDEIFGYEFTPDDAPPTHINRREAFRVNVSMRATLAGTTDREEESYETEWECAIRDLSVGGAKMVLRSPPPPPGSQALLHLELPTEQSMVVIPSIVIEANVGGNPPPMDTQVRLAFHAVTTRLESHLSRYVNWVQLDLLRKGIRST